MSTYTDENPKGRFLDAAPFLKLQKYSGFVFTAFMIAGLVYLTEVNVELVQKIMMYPDVNLWSFAASAMLFGTFCFVVLRETWFMKEKVGVEVFQKHLKVYCLDWTESEIAFNEIKSILVSNLFLSKKVNWIKFEKFSGEKISVPIKNLESFLNLLPPQFKNKIEHDNLSLNIIFASVFLLGSWVILFDALQFFLWFEMAFYGVILVAFYFFILFKKVFSSKKILRREFEIGILLIIPALFLNVLSTMPLNEVDQLFYSQLSMIDNNVVYESITDKIEMCDHVKTNYTNLKPKMLLELERVCSKKILEMSQRSNEELNKAFDWAYSEYVRKPEQFQIISLACLYAETNQKDFAVQLAAKHNLLDLRAHLKKGGRCRPEANRQVASAQNKE